MKASKGKGTREPSPPSHFITLHKRLRQALSLGSKIGDKKWHCSDVETQLHVTRVIYSFYSSLSSQFLGHPIVKNILGEALLALEDILWSKSEAALDLATAATQKLTEHVGNIPVHPEASLLVSPLLRLLSSRKSSIAVSSAISLGRIFSKAITPEWHWKIWKDIREINVLGTVANAIQDCINRHQSSEQFKAMSSLLRTILQQWPPSRFYVWNNTALLKGLDTVTVRFESSFLPLILQIISALALCGNVSMKLLDDGAIVSMMISCMNPLQPDSVHKEAFLLLQNLSRSEESWSKLMRTDCKSIVKSIVTTLNAHTPKYFVKANTDRVAVLLESCRAALIVRFPGEHHAYFWDFRVGQVLLHFLLSNPDEFSSASMQGHSAKLIASARDSFYKHTIFHTIRPYIWDMLGFLAINCPSGYHVDANGDTCHLNILIACTCTLSVKIIQQGTFAEKEFPPASECEPISRAALLMVYSQCEFIASQSRKYLSEALVCIHEKYLLQPLQSLRSAITESSSSSFSNWQAIMNLMSITYCLSLSQYVNLFRRENAMQTIMACLRKCLSCELSVARPSIAVHVKNTAKSQTCCWEHTEDWEGGNLVLFFSLWALYEFLRYQKNNSHSMSDNVSSELKKLEANTLVEILHAVYSQGSSHGVQIYVVHNLSLLGWYGYPSSYGERIRKALDISDLSNLQFRLSNGECVRVHKAILTIRCPSLLPAEDFGEISELKQSVSKMGTVHGEIGREIHLNSRIHYMPLLKLLEFVYGGFFQADDALLKELKLLSMHCNLGSLFNLLCRRRPIWGSVIPCLDLTPSLKSYVHLLDTVLECKPAQTTLGSVICVFLFPRTFMSIKSYYGWAVII